MAIRGGREVDVFRQGRRVGELGIGPDLFHEGVDPARLDELQRQKAGRQRVEIRKAVGNDPDPRRRRPDVLEDEVRVLDDQRSGALGLGLRMVVVDDAGQRLHADVEGDRPGPRVEDGAVGNELKRCVHGDGPPPSLRETG